MAIPLTTRRRIVNAHQGVVTGQGHQNCPGGVCPDGGEGGGMQLPGWGGYGYGGGMGGYGMMPVMMPAMMPGMQGGQQGLMYSPQAQSAMVGLGSAAGLLAMYGLFKGGQGIVKGIKRGVQRRRGLAFGEKVEGNVEGYSAEDRTNALAELQKSEDYQAMSNDDQEKAVEELETKYEGAGKNRYGYTKQEWADLDDETKLDARKTYKKRRVTHTKSGEPRTKLGRKIRETVANIGKKKKKVQRRGGKLKIARKVRKVRKVAA